VLTNIANPMPNFPRMGTSSPKGGKTYVPPYSDTSHRNPWWGPHAPWKSINRLMMFMQIHARFGKVNMGSYPWETYGGSGQILPLVAGSTRLGSFHELGIILYLGQKFRKTFDSCHAKTDILPPRGATFSLLIASRLLEPGTQQLHLDQLVTFEAVGCHEKPA
jgi:hypothetical protein